MIGLAGEERSGFQFRDKAIGGVELTVQLFQKVVLLLNVGLFLSEMNICFDVAGDGGELLVSSNLFLGALAFAENALSGFLIVPEIGVGDALFESLQALPPLRCVKDSSARARCVLLARRSDAGNLRGTCFFPVNRPFGNGRHFAFRRVEATRITETSTQSQANQSPKRV